MSDVRHQMNVMSFQGWADVVLLLFRTFLEVDETADAAKPSRFLDAIFSFHKFDNSIK
jgi:hypothetical protein